MTGVTILFWPFVVLGFTLFFLWILAGILFRNRPWLHPSWYALHLPFAFIQLFRKKED